MLQLLGLAHVGFCVANSEGVIQSADPAFSNMLHYEQINGGELRISDVTLPEDVGRLMDVMSRVSASGASLVYRRPAVCGDGEIIWVENRLSVLNSCNEKNFLVASRKIDKPRSHGRSSGLHFPARTCAAYVADLSSELSAMAAASHLTLTSEVLGLVADLVRGEVETVDVTLPAMAH